MKPKQKNDDMTTMGTVVTDNGDATFAINTFGSLNNYDPVGVSGGGNLMPGERVIVRFHGNNPNLPYIDCRRKRQRMGQGGGGVTITGWLQFHSDFQRTNHVISSTTIDFSTDTEVEEIVGYETSYVYRTDGNNIYSVGYSSGSLYILKTVISTGVTTASESPAIENAASSLCVLTINTNGYGYIGAIDSDGYLNIAKFLTTDLSITWTEVYNDEYIESVLEILIMTDSINVFTGSQNMIWNIDSSDGTLNSHSSPESGTAEATQAGGTVLLRNSTDCFGHKYCYWGDDAWYNHIIMNSDKTLFVIGGPGATAIRVRNFLGEIEWEVLGAGETYQEEYFFPITQYDDSLIVFYEKINTIEAITELSEPVTTLMRRNGFLIGSGGEGEHDENWYGIHTWEENIAEAAAILALALDEGDPEDYGTEIITGLRTYNITTGELIEDTPCAGTTIESEIEIKDAFTNATYTYDVLAHDPIPTLGEMIGNNPFFFCIIATEDLDESPIYTNDWGSAMTDFLLDYAHDVRFHFYVKHYSNITISTAFTNGWNPKNFALDEVNGDIYFGPGAIGVNETDECKSVAKHAISDLSESWKTDLLSDAANAEVSNILLCGDYIYVAESDNSGARDPAISRIKNDGTSITRFSPIASGNTLPSTAGQGEWGETVGADFITARSNGSLIAVIKDGDYHTHFRKIT